MDEILEILNRLGGDNPPSRDELTTARTELARSMRDARGAARPDLETLTSLRAAYDQAAEALTALETEEAELSEQAAQLLDGVEDPDDGDEADDGDAPAEVDDHAAEPVAAGAASPRVLPLNEALARLTPRQRQEQRPAAPAVPETSTRIFIQGQEHQGPIAVGDVAGVFERAGRSLSTGKQVLMRFDSTLPDGYRLPGNTSGNTAMVDAVVGPEAVAAAGGCCSLPTPLRTQTVLSSQARPLRDSLPTFGVTETGAVTFFPAICLPQAGAGIWTCDDDAAVDFADDTTWKECSFIECEDAQVVRVDGNYHCLVIGEYQRRFATEQWNGIIQAVLSEQARLADARLFAQMRAQVNTTHTGAATGSLLVNLIQTVQLATDTIRQTQRYMDVQMRLFIAEWVRGAIRSDLVARRLVDVDNPVAADGFLTTALANAGVNVTWSPDIDIIESGAQPGASTPAALTPYPDTAHAVLAPEGHFTFLDGGQLDLGTEIRDHDLNRQNAVAAFAESFEGLLTRGCNAKGLDIPVEICETAAGCAEVIS